MTHALPCWLTLAVALVNCVLLLLARSLMRDLRAYQSWWHHTFVVGGEK